MKILPVPSSAEPQGCVFLFTQVDVQESERRERRKVLEAETKQHEKSSECEFASKEDRFYENNIGTTQVKTRDIQEYIDLNLGRFYMSYSSLRAAVFIRLKSAVCVCCRVKAVCKLSFAKSVCSCVPVPVYACVSVCVYVKIDTLIIIITTETFTHILVKAQCAAFVFVLGLVLIIMSHSHSVSLCFCLSPSLPPSLSLSLFLSLICLK